jgi:predicted Fe-Mo cluster-binding NifX family protein
MRIAIAAETNNGLDSLASAHFGHAGFFVLVDVDGSEPKAVKAVDTVENPFYGGHQPGQLPEFLHQQGADVLLSGGMGHRAVAFFQQYGIQPVTGASGTVRDALEDYLGGTLSGAEACADGQHLHVGNRIH